MFRRWITAASLTLAWPCLVACGDRFGQPIVVAPVDSGEAGAAGADPAAQPSGGGGTGSGGTGGGKSDAGAGGDGAATPPQGPLGLCAPCSGSDACGDVNDACLRRDDQLFCGRDCEEGQGCPEGYECVQLDNIRLWQCVPDEACPVSVTQPPPLEEIRDYFANRIRAVRAAEGRNPLSPSSCLDEVAQASAIAYAHTDEPLGKFVDECEPVWPSCNCGWNAQAEVAVAYQGLDWTGAIERALETEAVTVAILAYDVASLGIGFWTSGDEAWIALSFH